MKDKKHIKYAIIILIILLVIPLIAYLKRTELLRIFINKDKQEVIKDITFDIYSYENDIMKVLVTAEDTENKIKKLSYIVNGEEKILNTNSKEKVAIDYEIQKDGEYTFTATNGLDEQIQKTLVINSDTKDNLIKINIKSDRELGTVLNVNIEYLKDLSNTYKIGINDEWKNYKGEFSVTSYEVLENNYQDLNGETVTIYAKTEDIAQNKIIISKQSANLDLKKAEDPIITADKTTQYPVLTTTGIYALTNVSIQYDDLYETDNYYSLDKGKTWHEYKGSFETSITENQTSGTIMAKSVKKVSGLESISEITIPLIEGSLGLLAYDGDENTAVDSPIGNKKYEYYLKIDSSAYLKQFQILQNTINQGSGGSPYMSITFYDKDNNILGEEYFYRNVGTNYKSNIICPYDAAYVKFILSGSSGWGSSSKCSLKEISVSDINNKIQFYNKSYPTLKSDGVTTKGNKVYIAYPYTYKQQFYKIGENSSWQTCEKTIGIDFTLGDTIYAKGIDEFGKETEEIKYTPKMTNNAILESAYDGDEETNMIIHAGYNDCKPVTVNKKYMMVDSSAWEKQLQIKWYCWGYSGYVAYLNLLDSNNNVLGTINISGGVTRTDVMTIPKNTTKIEFSMHLSNPGWDINARIYEIGIKK